MTAAERSRAGGTPRRGPGGTPAAGERSTRGLPARLECNRSPTGVHELTSEGLGEHCVHCMTVPLAGTGMVDWVLVNGVPRRPAPLQPPASWKPGKTISSYQRVWLLRAIIDRDGSRCFYCERVLDEPESDPAGPDAPTIDHFLARSRGGGWDLDNLVVACRGCNSRKGSELLVVMYLIRRLRRHRAQAWDAIDRAGRKIEHQAAQIAELEAALAEARRRWWHRWRR